MSRENIIAVLMIMVGLIKLAPVVGVLGAEQLSNLYGFATLEGDLLVLMRHRALLFGIVGLFIIYAAFKRTYQPAAMLMAGASLLGYILLVYLMDEPGAALQRIAIIDAFACLPLLLAIFLYRSQGKQAEA